MQKSHCVNTVEETHWVEITLCHYRQRRSHWAEITLCQHHRRHSRRGISQERATPLMNRGKENCASDGHDLNVCLLCVAESSKPTPARGRNAVKLYDEQCHLAWCTGPTARMMFFFGHSKSVAHQPAATTTRGGSTNCRWWTHGCLSSGPTHLQPKNVEESCESRVVSESARENRSPRRPTFDAPWILRCTTFVRTRTLCCLRFGHTHLRVNLLEENCRERHCHDLHCGHHSLRRPAANKSPCTRAPRGTLTPSAVQPASTAKDFSWCSCIAKRGNKLRSRTRACLVRHLCEPNLRNNLSCRATAGTCPLVLPTPRCTVHCSIDAW